MLRARADARRPEPLCALCVLDLHDAAETFVRVIADVHHADVRSKHYFSDYWGPIQQKTGVDLGFKASMTDLNTMRNSFKHSGLASPKTECDSIVARTEEFLRENSVKFLGVPFEQVSIADLIQWPKTRAALAEAEAALGIGDYQRALDYTAVGFRLLMSEYSAAQQSRYPWILPGPPTVRVRTGGLYGAEADLEGLAESANAAIAEIHDDLRLLALGIDAVRGEHLRLIGPHVTQLWDGMGSLILNHRDTAPTEADTRSCFDFAIESALRLQTIAAHLGLVIPAAPSDLPPISVHPSTGTAS
jgi:hypothetical protein